MPLCPDRAKGKGLTLVDQINSLVKKGTSLKHIERSKTGAPRSFVQAQGKLGLRDLLNLEIKDKAAKRPDRVLVDQCVLRGMKLWERDHVTNYDYVACSNYVTDYDYDYVTGSGYVTDYNIKYR